MEKLIRNPLRHHMINEKILSDYQHGFILGRSCTTQLLQVFDKWTEILDEGGCVNVIYLNLAKAFYTKPLMLLLFSHRSALDIKPAVNDIDTT